MISIDWLTKIIFVPKSYTQFVSFVLFEVRQLDIDQFRLDLRTLEAEVPGIVNTRTHSHNTSVEVGGVTLARVVTIINGYTITFEDGSYAVNLNGANSNIADVTNLNQVQIRSANSAGLTFSDEINNQSYQGRVWINTFGIGLPGTGFPRGTPTSPVDNWDDALTIATTRNFDNYNLDGELTFTGATVPIGTGVTTTIVPINLSNTQWFGASPTISEIYAETLPLYVAGATFDRMSINGELSGNTTLNDCSIVIDGFEGIANNCGLNGDISIAQGDDLSITFRDCYSLVAGTLTPNIDFSGVSNTGASFRGYNGGLQINNFGQDNNLSLDISTGNITLDSSCTGGTIVVRGLANLIDNSTSGCTVITNGLLDPSDIFSTGNTQSISDAVWATLTNNPNPGSYGQLLVDLFNKSTEVQHTLNVHTEQLKNKPNNC
jgi:hypothetical protein